MQAEEGLEVKRIVCNNGGPGCWIQCGLLAHVDKKTGRLVKVTGNPEHPASRGFICHNRLDHAVEWLYHKDQLMFPLKRAGERGEGKWKRISWNQALDEIADKL